MNLRGTDYLLCRIADGASPVLKLIGDMESDLLRRRFDEVAIERPVFICGLARSGTTVLLDLFSRLEPVGTHRYRDFPFLLAPCWWNWCGERLGRSEHPVERPHKDRIKITKESPEAFEEPIWRYFFPLVSDADRRHVLGREHRDADFDAFFSDHIRKVLLLRGKRRYVSKGNYNITRLAYLADLFPDARFVIPVRHPVDHVRSLVRQHRLFTEYGEKDPRVPRYLRFAGHFEFGVQRMPINVDADETSRIMDAWTRQDDALGYAIAWRTVYGHALAAAEEPGLGDRMRFVHYEDFCERTESVMAELLRFCGLEEHFRELGPELSSISAPAGGGHDEGGRIWGEAAPVATRLGYAERTVFDPGQA